MRVPKPDVAEGDGFAHWVDCYYCGEGPELAAALAATAHGGQVVLNEQAWRAVLDRLPGRCQVRSVLVMPPFCAGCGG